MTYEPATLSADLELMLAANAWVLDPGRAGYRLAQAVDALAGQPWPAAVEAVAQAARGALGSAPCERERRREALRLALADLARTRTGGMTFDRRPPAVAGSFRRPQGYRHRAKRAGERHSPQKAPAQAVSAWWDL